MKLFRAMREAADGLPEVGPTARTLGVRPGPDPRADVAAVAPDDWVLPGTGGLSTVPDDPIHLPHHRRPAILGGPGRDPVWVIDSSTLGTDLAARQDQPTHVHVEPAAPMTLQSFQDALTATRPLWRVHCR
jgi:hypothetical protein